MKKNLKDKKKLITTIFAIVITILVTNITTNQNLEKYIKNPESLIAMLTNKTEEYSIKIHYLDVDQGDSIFIELPNKETMLIDAAEKEYGKKIITYIKNLKYDRINYVVATHPHTDHIGGMEDIINKFNIDKIYMPKALTTTKTYSSLLDTIKNKNLTINRAKAGVTILNEKDLNIEIISPTNDEYEDLNNYSAVIKIEYKGKKFLFMGDAEKEIENHLNIKEKIDVIKVGHHGSDTSSTKKFIKNINPSIAIISVGKDNTYNHPNEKIIKRYKDNNTQVYRTDVSGTITVSYDGDEIKVNTEK